MKGNTFFYLQSSELSPTLLMKEICLFYLVVIAVNWAGDFKESRWITSWATKECVEQWKSETKKCLCGSHPT